MPPKTDRYDAIIGVACDPGSDLTERRERVTRHQCRPTSALPATRFAAHASCTGRRPPVPWVISEQFVVALAISAVPSAATGVTSAAAIG